jgi:predicted patatin/cPLA2 family phospholipase
MTSRFKRDRKQVNGGGEMNPKFLRRSTSKIFGVVVVLIAIVTGCASVRVRNPVPEDLIDKVKISNIPIARVWGDESPPYAKEWLKLSKSEIKKQYPALFRSPHNYLAISGGGANGAFGAGLLAGWTTAGDRPDFSMVTGISTGALSAPFAFLGSAYDARLKEVYTTYSTKDLIRKRNILEIIFGDSAFSTKPLKALIAKYYNAEVLKAIAAEFRKGRQLYIGTVNIDAERPVIWNISKIAASGNPKALELVHKILLASASIPGIFPPILINVEIEGKSFDEMHVDGGTASQVFLYPADLDWLKVTEKLEVKGKPHAYIIRNALLDSRWKAVDPKIIPIAGRSIQSLLRTQGFGDLYRLYLFALRDGLDYNLAYIPDYFELKPKELFDTEYMSKLYELGYWLAKSGYPWHKGPPGFETQ